MTGAPSAILLDLDGTLVDSEPGILASSHAALRALGHRTDDLDLAGMIGPPLEEVMAQVLARLGDDRVDQAVAAYREHYGAEGLLAATPYPGISDMLEALPARGVALYVATSKRRVFAERILQRLGLIDRFAGVHGSEPGGALDRKAPLIAHVLQRHSLSAGRCLMVGDRSHDIVGATANGMAAVGVLWGYGDREELEAAGAWRVIAEPPDLMAVIGEDVP